MIEILKLNNQKVMLNADLIETLESTPDTIITLYTGKKIMVRDSVEEIVRKVMEYKKTIGAQVNVLRRREESAGGNP